MGCWSTPTANTSHGVIHVPWVGHAVAFASRRFDDDDRPSSSKKACAHRWRLEAFSIDDSDRVTRRNVRVDGSSTAWARNAAQVGQNLAGGMDRECPCLQAHNPVRRDTAQFLCAFDRGSGLRTVDAIEREYRV